MNNASEAILALKPVTFRYRSDKTNTPQFGLIAEEVAAVNPDLVVHDKKGEYLTVRYDAVNAMLLNEFLKEHKQFKEDQATLTHLRLTVARQEKKLKSAIAQIKEQAAQIQRVSARTDLRTPTPQQLALKIQ